MEELQTHFIKPGDLDALHRQLAKAGWKLHSVVPTRQVETSGTLVLNQALVIFARPKRYAM